MEFLEKVFILIQSIIINYPYYTANYKEIRMTAQSEISRSLIIIA